MLECARATEENHEKPGERSIPVHGGEVLLQVTRVHVGLAELQLSSGVVVHVVDAHFLHDAETSLGRRDGEDVILRRGDVKVWNCDGDDGGGSPRWASSGPPCCRCTW